MSPDRSKKCLTLQVGTPFPKKTGAKVVREGRIHLSPNLRPREIRYKNNQLRGKETFGDTRKRGLTGLEFYRQFCGSGQWTVCFQQHEVCFLSHFITLLGKI